MTQLTVQNHRFSHAFAVALAATTALCGSPVSASAQAVIDNGTVQIGINPFGNLIVSGFGLTYLPTSAETLAPGCHCEGWGLADLGIGVGFGRSVGNGDSGTGTSALTVSGTGTHSASSGSSATTTTTIQEGGLDFVQAVHSFTPSSNSNLYQVDVTLTNLGGLPITNLVYRRVMDWDMPPTEFSEFVTLQGWPAGALIGSSDNGFSNPNPNSGALNIISPTSVLNGNFSDDGPFDHGAAFDFSFGTLAPGATQTFTFFYGAAGTVDEALATLGSVGAEVYSLGYPNDGSEGPNPTGAPNVVIFAFAGVGGTPVGGGIGIGPQGELQLLRNLGAFVAQAIVGDPLLRIDGTTDGGEGGRTIEAGLRLLATGGLSNSNFMTTNSLDADVNIGRGGIVAEYVFDPAGSMIGPRLGIGVDYVSADGSLSNGSSADAGATTLHAYAGTSFDNGAYVDGSLGYSWLNYDTVRAPDGGNFVASFGGSQVSAMVRAGFDYKVETDRVLGELSIGPFASLLYTSNSINGYTETSTILPAGAVSFASQTANSLTARLGARVNYKSLLDNGAAFVASAWAGYEIQAVNGAMVAGTSAMAAPTTTAVPSLRHDMGFVGTRVGININDKLTITGEYEGAFGKDITRHNAMARLKLRW